MESLRSARRHRELIGLSEITKMVHDEDELPITGPIHATMLESHFQGGTPIPPRHGLVVLHVLSRPIRTHHPRRLRAEPIEMLDSVSLHLLNQSVWSIPIQLN